MDNTMIVFTLRPWRLSWAITGWAKRTCSSTTQSIRSAADRLRSPRQRPMPPAAMPVTISLNAIDLLRRRLSRNFSAAPPEVPGHVVRGSCRFKPIAAWRKSVGTAAAGANLPFPNTITRGRRWPEKLDLNMHVQRCSAWSRSMDQTLEADPLSRFKDHRPVLFDLENDPGELVDLGERPDHEEIIAELYDMLFSWARRQSQRTTRSEAQLREMRGRSRRRGIMIGIYDENDVPLELTTKYRNRKAERKI